MIVKFWGVRGSYTTVRAEVLKYGGHTSCMSIQIDDKLLVIDAGSGVRVLGDEIDEKVRDVYFILTHLHRDHINGFPFFHPLYVPGRRIHLIDYRRGGNYWSLISMLDGLHYPMRPSSVMAPHECISRGPMKYLRAEGFDISRLKLNHPGGAYGYRIEHDGKVVIHIPDNELNHLNPETPFDEIAAFCKDADILSHDAMYISDEMPEKRGWGHSTVDEACNLAIAADVGHLVLFHHAPERDDAQIDRLQELAKQKLASHQIECTAAYEGLRFAF